MGRSLKSSKRLNEDVKVYLQERKGLEKRKRRQDFSFCDSYGILRLHGRKQRLEQDTIKKNIGKLVQARAMFQPWCESTCYACTHSDPPQHHSLLPHGNTCIPPSIRLTLCWHSTSVASASSCSSPSLWIPILDSQFHQMS